MPRRRSVSLEPEELTTASPRRSTRLSRVHTDSPLITPKLESIEEKKPAPARRARRSMSAQVESKSVVEEKEVELKPSRRSTRITVKQDDKIGLATPIDKAIEIEEQKETERLRRTTRSMSKSPTAPVTTGRVTPTTAKKQAAKRRLSAIEKITEEDKENILEAISENEEIQAKNETIPETNNNIKNKKENSNEITDGETTDQEKENTNQNADNHTPKKSQKSISRTSISNKKPSITDDLVQEKLNESGNLRLHISDDEDIQEISTEKTPKRVLNPLESDTKVEEASRVATIINSPPKTNTPKKDTKTPQIDTTGKEDPIKQPTEKLSPEKLEENEAKEPLNSPKGATKEKDILETKKSSSESPKVASKMSSTSSSGELEIPSDQNKEESSKMVSKKPSTSSVEEIPPVNDQKEPNLVPERSSLSSGEELGLPTDQKESKQERRSLGKTPEKPLVTNPKEIVREIDNILVTIENGQNSPETKTPEKDDLIATLLDEAKKEIDIPEIYNSEQSIKNEVQSLVEEIKNTPKKEVLDKKDLEENSVNLEEALDKTSSPKLKFSSNLEKDGIEGSGCEKSSSKTLIVAVCLEGLGEELEEEEQNGEGACVNGETEEEKLEKNEILSLSETTPVKKPEDLKILEKDSKPEEKPVVLEDRKIVEKNQNTSTELQNIKTSKKDKLIEEQPHEEEVFKDNLENENEFESNISIVGSESPDFKEKSFSTEKPSAVETNEEERENNLSMVNDDGKSYSPIHNTYDISSPIDKKLDELINSSNLKRKGSKQSAEMKKFTKNEVSSSSDEDDEEEEADRDVVSRKRRWERNSQVKDSPVIKKKKMIQKPKQPFSDDDEDVDIWTDGSDENSSDDDNFIANEFVDDQAVEGEEDTPSEDSNQIIDEGESIGSTTDDESMSDEQSLEDFVVNDDDYEDSLLSGEENFLESPNKESRPSWSGGKKKKHKRIIEICSDDQISDTEGSVDNLSIKPSVGNSPTHNKFHINVVDSDDGSIEKRNRKLSEMIENNEKIESDQEIETIDLDSDTESETKNLAKTLHVEKESADILKDFCDLAATPKTKEQIAEENALALKEIEKEVAELKKQKSCDVSLEIVESAEEKPKNNKKKQVKPPKMDSIDLADESTTSQEENNTPVSEKASKKLNKSFNSEEMTQKRLSSEPKKDYPVSKRKSTTSSEGSPDKIPKIHLEEDTKKSKMSRKSSGDQQEEVQENIPELVEKKVEENLEGSLKKPKNKKKKSLGDQEDEGAALESLEVAPVLVESKKVSEKLDGSIKKSKNKKKKSLADQDDEDGAQESSEEVPVLVESKKTLERLDSSFKKPISAFKEKKLRKMKQFSNSEEEKSPNVVEMELGSAEKKKKSRQSSSSENWVEEKLEKLPTPDKSAKLSPVALKSSSKKKLKSRKTTSGDWIEDSLLIDEDTPKDDEPVFEETNIMETKNGKPVLYSYQSVEDQSPSIFKDHKKAFPKDPEGFKKSPCAFHLLKLSRDASIEIKSCEKSKQLKKHSATESQFILDAEEEVFQGEEEPREQNSEEKKQKKKSKSEDEEKQTQVPESLLLKKKSKKDWKTSQESGGHFDSDKENGSPRTADSSNMQTENLVLKKKSKKGRKDSGPKTSKGKKKSPKQEEERLSVKKLVEKYEMLSPKPQNRSPKRSTKAPTFKIEKSKNEKASINELNEPTPSKPITKRGLLKPDLHGSTNCPSMKIEIVENLSNLSKKIKKREKKLKYQNNSKVTKKVEVMSGQKATNFKTEFLFGDNVKRIDSQQFLQIKQKKKF